jgi:DNA-binding NtrC family response regulator
MIDRGMKSDVARQRSVLVVEDDAAVRFGICGALRRLDLDVVEAGSCAEAARLFVASVPDVVIADLRLPDGEALELLAKLRGIDATVPVFIMTGYGTIQLAVRAVKEGAEDFFTKPLDLDALGGVVLTAIGRRRLVETGPRVRSPSLLTHAPLSNAMKRLEEELERLRDADCSVLILGETGTGKSLLARRIHSLGARSSGPFVDVNCAGLTREFVESELFGHERGAFTGAHAMKQGLLDAADRGTLFLDEVGDIDVAVQPKILKVVEEKRFRRMGDVRERSVDVRLIAATHHDLMTAVADRRFRADLYYRLSTFSITMPALRERLEDLVPLAYQLLAQLGAKDVRLSTDAEALLMEQRWPGNLRELKNVLERALIRHRGAVIERNDLRFDAASNPRIRVASGTFEAAEATPAMPLSTRTLSQMEMEHIQQTLLAENGKVEAAAKRLGIPRSTLYQRMKAYGIQPAHFRGRTGSDEDR